MKTTAITLGLLLAGISAQAGTIESVDGFTIEGGAWNNDDSTPEAPRPRQVLKGWTITATGADLRSATDTVAFASNGQSTLEVGNFGSGSRIGRDFLRNAASSWDTNGDDLDASFSWFQDGDTIDLSGEGDSSLNLAAGLTAGSNWAFISFDSAPINYTGYTAELGGVSQVAFELIWVDADNSGHRSAGDTYDIGTILYATGGDTFNDGSWTDGTPTIAP